ncbi:IS30 family transposase [Clostridium paraputrificum]
MLKFTLPILAKMYIKKHRSNSCRTFKLFECSDFIKYTVDKIKNNSWSPDACAGEAIATGRFNCSQMVCTKTLYNYIDLGFMDIKNTDLPMKLRRNTKLARVKKHKKKLGTSISQRPIDIDNRTEFGHWEIDTVIGEKTKDDNVLLTIVERKTRYAMVLKAIAKTAPAITDALNKVRDIFGEQFSQVFKSITSDNDSEFADLSTI